MQKTVVYRIFVPEFQLSFLLLNKLVPLVYIQADMSSRVATGPSLFAGL